MGHHVKRLDRPKLGYIVAAMKLDRYLRDANITSHEFAKRLKGASVHAVRKWRQGTRIPRAPMVAKIDRVTRGYVKAGDWY